ncbi:MAG TPA: hypothetical protein VNZ67_12925, partial [bacterium]|nr:hypothetical protein [bacterium]
HIFDLEEAAKAAATEAGDEPFPFTYKGASYEIPPGNSWPVAALAALGAGELESALSELLGGDTYGKLTAAGLTVGQLNTLFTEAGRRAGFPSLPNSPSLAPPSLSPT